MINARAIGDSAKCANQVCEDLAEIRRKIEAALRSRVERDVQDGFLPADCDAEMRSGHAFAVVQGMSTLAKDGAKRQMRLKIVDATMACWPVAA